MTLIFNFLFLAFIFKPGTKVYSYSSIWSKLPEVGYIKLVAKTKMQSND